MSLKGKNTKSIKRKDLPNSRRNVTGIKSVKFHHQASAGEIIIDITSLVTPAGFVNPLPSTLAQLRMKSFSENLVLLSSSKGTLMEGVTLSYTHQDEVTIKLNFEADEGEIFTGVFFNHQINGTLIADVRTPGDSGIIIDTQTSFNLGESVPIEDLNNQWPIQVFRDSGSGLVPQLRNTGNGASGGDYQMIDSGDGSCQLLEFNVAAVGGDDTVIWANHGALAERPNLSVLQQVDALNGTMDRMKDDLLEATGFDVTDPTRYNGVPTNQDLKSFGDKVQAILGVEVSTVVEEVLSMDGFLGVASTRIQFKNTIQSTLNEVAVLDNSSFTKVTALKECFITAQGGGERPAGGHNVQVEVYNDSNVKQLSSRDGQSTANNNANASLSFKLLPGWYVVIHNGGDVYSDAFTCNFSFRASAITTKKIQDLI